MLHAQNAIAMVGTCGVENAESMNLYATNALILKERYGLSRQMFLEILTKTTPLTETKTHKNTLCSKHEGLNDGP